MEYLKIRPLTTEDLEAIVAIDEKVLGEKRRDYWEKKLQMMDDKASQVSLVVEVKGKVLGFILGDISGWNSGAGYDRVD
jgi:predicted N-acetyltransferase YhbS